MSDTRKSPIFLLKELFSNLPVLFILFTAYHMLVVSIKWFEPAHYEWAWTIVFPLFWVFAFLWVRLYMNDDVENKNGVLYTFVALAAAGVAVVMMLAQPKTLGLDQIIRDHECTTFVWVALLMLHCLVYRGIKGFVTFFMIGLLYGALLESSGIQYNFFFEPHYHLYAPEALQGIFRAPIATITGWTTVFYPAVFVTEKIFDKIKVTNLGIRAVNATLVGLFIDLQVDPVASEIGLWNWNERLAPGFLGVPLLNFVSWFWAVIPFAFMVWFVERKHEQGDWSLKKRLVVLLISVPFCQAFAGACTFLTMMVIEGVSGPSMQILIESMKAQLGAL